MSIGVNVSLPVQLAAEGSRVVRVNGVTIGECLLDLARQLPKVEKEIFDSTGKIRPDLMVWINGEPIYTGVPDRPVRDDDELHIMQMIAGG